MLFCRYVRPVIPRRLAGLLGEIINAIDGSSLIRAHNNKCGINTGKWITHNLGEVGFPFALDGRDIDLPGGDKFIDELALTDGSDDDRDALIDLDTGNHIRLLTRDGGYVR